MSHQTGIKSNDQLRNFFAKSKEGNIRMFKVVINDSEELVLDTHHTVNNVNWQSNYDEFVLKAIDTKTPCFIFYRLDERKDTGFVWLFISWSPDFAPIKQKMLYAATKSTLKLEFGAGEIKDELFGTARDDISLDGYLKHIQSQSAPKPLTNREEELVLLRQGEDHSRINVNTKQKTLQGVMFPIDATLAEKLEDFKQARIDYVQFEIDIKGRVSDLFFYNL